MNHQNAAESTVQAFCRSWFEQRDAEGTLSFLQVLINILSNAIKFTGEGGKVTFSAAQRKRTKNDAVIRFIVNDTGVGMSEEFLPHIFEPFSQESTGTTALYGGTGLGLAISKNIVDMMDGSICLLYTSLTETTSSWITVTASRCCTPTARRFWPKRKRLSGRGKSWRRWAPQAT